MKIPKTNPAGEEPRSIQVQPSGTRAAAMFATLALASACILSGMLAGTAATARTAQLFGFASDSLGSYAEGVHISSTAGFHVLTCGGRCPGFCPCPSELKDGSTPISNSVS